MPCPFRRVGLTGAQDSFRAKGSKTCTKEAAAAPSFFVGGSGYPDAIAGMDGRVFETVSS